MTKERNLLRVMVRRVFFDAIKAGEKTIEYRRHRPPYTARNFYPGREFWLDWRHSHATHGEHGMLMHCRLFEVRTFERLDEAIRASLAEIYPDVAEGDEFALIHLAHPPSQE
jgi:hypothetical protein